MCCNLKYIRLDKIINVQAKKGGNNQQFRIIMYFI